MSSSHIIKSFDIIDSDTQNLINIFLSNSTLPSIIDVAKFLKDTLNIDATTDVDIIAGYNHDWSNLKGDAQVLCRPISKAECAIIMKVCYALNINYQQRHSAELHYLCWKN